MKFNRDTIENAKAHAISSYPNESCGVVIDGAYIPCRNVAENPLKDFAIDPNDWAGVGILEGVIHSHPDSSAAPTFSDMESQQRLDIPFGIIHTDGVIAQDPVMLCDDMLDIPLVGRQFMHGITDCYSIIRSWYWQELGIKIPDFPRSDLWWSNGENLYLENFEKAGFKRIFEHETQICCGDVFLAQIRSQVPNHGGIVLGENLGLHHLPNRLSRREPIGPWKEKFITHWLRYAPQDLPTRVA